VRMQALHALSRSPDPAEGPRADVIFWYRRVSFGGVRSVAGLELLGVDCRLGSRHPVRRLEPADDATFVRADQPKLRWHRRSVIEQRRVLQHNRLANSIPDDDLERALGLAPEKPRNGFAITRRGRCRHPSGGYPGRPRAERATARRANLLETALILQMMSEQTDGWT